MIISIAIKVRGKTLVISTDDIGTVLMVLSIAIIIYASVLLLFGFSSLANDTLANAFYVLLAAGITKCCRMARLHNIIVSRVTRTKGVFLTKLQLPWRKRAHKR